MTRHVTIDELPAKLAEVIEQVRRGDEVVIADQGGEVAKIVPTTAGTRRVSREPGWGKDMVKIIGDVMEPLPKEIEDEFYR